MEALCGLEELEDEFVGDVDQAKDERLEKKELKMEGLAGGSGSGSVVVVVVVIVELGLSTLLG